MADPAALYQIQKDFKQALLSPEPLGDTVFMDHLDPTLPHPERRLQAYRDNVIISLISVLASAYPVIATLLGDSHFRLLARDFIRRFPPAQAHLSIYGQQFSEFCASYPPLQMDFAYISDLASVEWARNVSFQAEDRPALTPEKAATFDQETLLNLTLVWHPSLHLIPVEYQISSLFENPPEPENLPTGQTLIGTETHVIWCDGWHVHSDLASPAESLFLQLLSTPAPLHHILEQYLQTFPLTTLQTVLATQFHHGRLCLSDM